MAENFTIRQTVDLSGINPNWNAVRHDALMYPGDNLAHTWEVQVKRNGIPVDMIGGNVVGYFQRKDGNTVMVNGTIEDSICKVTMAQECYAISGAMKAVMRYTEASTHTVITLAYHAFTVQGRIDDGGIIDPGEVIPSIDDLLAEIEAMEEATAAAEAAATKSVRYDSAQTLTDAQKEQARGNVGAASEDDVTDLKSHLTEITGCEIIQLNSGEYYNTSGTTVDISSPSTNSGWDSAVVECSAGDVFYVTGYSGSGPRLWAFVESDGTILDPRAIGSLTGDKLKITAPTNAAYLVVNANNSYARELTKGRLLVDNVTDNTNALDSVFVHPPVWDDFVLDLILYDNAYEKLAVRYLYINYNDKNFLVQFVGLSNDTWTTLGTYSRASAPAGRPDVELVELDVGIKGKILLDWTKAPSTLNFSGLNDPLIIKDQCRALEEDVADAKTDIINKVTAITDCTILPLNDGKYYATNGDSVNVASPSSNSGWTSAAISCQPGDIFTVTGTGGSSPRLWAFVESDGTILDPRAISGKVESRGIHVAPANAAYFVVNMVITNPHELFAGIPVNEKISADGYEVKDNIRQTIVVDASGNGDYTTLGAAYASITDSSIFNQYEIIVLPGEYQEQYLTPPPFTHTHGIKAENTIITSVGLEYDSAKNDWLSVFEMRNSCKLSNLTIISGTKYCIHEDNASLSRQTIVCRNLILHQTRAHNNSAVGNGTQFGGTKYVFSNCAFINGYVVTHSNTAADLGANQHIVFDGCKFIDSVLALSSVATAFAAIEGNYVCEINNCTFNPASGSVMLRFGSAITGMSAPNFPWNLCGAGNEGVDITFDNTADTRYTDAWDSVNLIEKTYVKVAASVTKGQYVDASGAVTTSDADKYGRVLANTSANEYAPILRVK